MNEMTSAICDGVNDPFHGGICVAYDLPITAWPCSPLSTTAMTFAGSPATNGLLSSGGARFGTPPPVALWHDAQFWEKTAWPSATGLDEVAPPAAAASSAPGGGAP